MKPAGAELLRSLKDVNPWDLPWDEERAVFEAIGRRHVGCVGEEGKTQADADFELAFVEMVRQAPRHASLRHDERPWTDYQYAVTLLRLASEVSGYQWRCFEFMFRVLEKHFAWFPQFLVQAISLSLAVETGTLLQFLKARGLYAVQREHLYLNGQTVAHPLHEAGSASACEQLLNEGHDPLAVNERGQTALVAAAAQCRPFACPMVGDVVGKQGVLRVLLSRGADVEQLLQEPHACSAVLEVILERRGDAFNRLSPLELLRGCVNEYHGSGKLPELVRLMILFKKHDIQLPEDVRVWVHGLLEEPNFGARDEQLIHCVLFMFGFMDALPERARLSAVKSWRRPHFLWRPAWHHFHPPERRERIVLLMLILNRLCPEARDLRFAIIDMMVCLEVGMMEEYDCTRAAMLFARQLDPYLPRAHRLDSWIS